MKVKIKLTTALSIAALVIIGAGTYAHVETRALFATQNHTCTVSFQAPAITAQAAYVYDVKTGSVLFAKNDEAQLPLASLTKITTALVAANELDTTKTISIQEDALTPEGDSGLFAGEVWKIGDLLDFMLITSSNDGARALAISAGKGSVEAFITIMNTFVQGIGAEQTFFLNETGLDISSSTAGAYGSARDMALLLIHAYKENQDTLAGSAQAASSYTSLSGFEHPVEHTSNVTGTIPGELIVKTGFTDLAGGNLAVLSEILPGRPVAFVVLGADRQTRDTDVQTLVSATKKTLRHATLCSN